MYIKVLSNLKDDYFIPTFRAIKNRDSIGSFASKLFGLNGQTSFLEIGIRRIIRLSPHAYFHIYSIVNRIFFGSHNELKSKIYAFEKIIQIKNNPTLIKKLNSVEIEEITHLLRETNTSLIDRIEWNSSLHQNLNIWILRALAFISDDNTFGALRLKCEQRISEGFFSNKLDWHEANFLLQIAVIKGLLNLFIEKIPIAAKFLVKLETLPGAETIAKSMSDEIQAQFKHGDILYDDVLLKHELFGIHLRYELFKIYMTQGSQFHVGVLFKEKNKLRENMLSLYGYIQKPLHPLHFLPIKILRVFDDHLKKEIARQSNIKIKCTQVSFFSHMKTFLGLHKNIEGTMLRLVQFKRQESCSSYVAKVINNSLFKLMTLAENPFNGYDLDRITPNAIKKCLIESGLAENIDPMPLYSFLSLENSSK